MNTTSSIVLLLTATLLLAGCTTASKQEDNQRPNDISYLAKTDIDTVADTHYRSQQRHLRTLSEKLYKRNPRYCHNPNGLQACIKEIFSKRPHPLAISCRNGLACMDRALSGSFQGDRIRLLMVGMKQMLDASYNFKNSFYIIDELDEQKLYNSARNLEIALWRIKNRGDNRGNAYILSNTTSGKIVNVSFERLFGKMISLQETLSAIVAQQNQRLVKNILQRLATAVFLPI